MSTYRGRVEKELFLLADWMDVDAMPEEEVERMIRMHYVLRGDKDYVTLL